MRWIKPLVTILGFAVCAIAAWLVYDDSLVSAGSSDGPSLAHKWLGVGSESKAGGTAKKDRNKLPVAVEVVTVRQQPMQDRVELVGSLQPIASVEIRSRVSGYIKHLPHDVGDEIDITQTEYSNEEDRFVVVLDDSRHLELMAGFQAVLDVAHAQKVSQEATRDLAIRKLNRQKELAKSGVSTTHQEEEAAAELKVAEAELRLEEARVRQAQSDFDSSKLALEELNLKPPMSGVIAERFVEVGDLADPNLPLLRIVDLSKVKTIVHVVERDHPRIQPGQTASLRVDAFPDKVFHGVVIRKSPILSEATRTGEVHIQIHNPGQLAPGMHGRVEIVFESKKQADVVPVSSIIESNRETSVFVIQGNPPTSRLRRVKTGIRTDGVVEVISGLQPEDQVVTLGSRLIKDGQVVQPVQGRWPLPRHLAASNVPSTGDSGD